MYPWLTSGPLAATSIWQATILLHKIWCCDQHSSFSICILKSRADHQSSPCRQYMLAVQQLACRPKQTEVLPRTLREAVMSWEIQDFLPTFFLHSCSLLNPQRAACCVGWHWLPFPLAFWLAQGPSTPAGFLQSSHSGIRHFTLRHQSTQFSEEENGFKLCVWIYCWAAGELPLPV